MTTRNSYYGHFSNGCVVTIMKQRKYRDRGKLKTWQHYLLLQNSHSTLMVKLAVFGPMATFGTSVMEIEKQYIKQEHYTDSMHSPLNQKEKTITDGKRQLDIPYRRTFLGNIPKTKQLNYQKRNRNLTSSSFQNRKLIKCVSM